MRFLKKARSIKYILMITLALLLSKPALAANVEISVFDSAINIRIDGQDYSAGDLIFINSSDILRFNSIFDGLKSIEANISYKNKNIAKDIIPISFIETGTLSNWSWQALSPVVGDFIGGEEDDLLALYGRAGNFSMIWGFEGDDHALLEPISLWASGYDKWDGDKTQLTTGDFNDDGLTDLMAFYGHSNSNSKAWLFENSGRGFKEPDIWWSSIDSWNEASSKVVSGDFDDDGLIDLLSLYTQDDGRSILWFFENNGEGLSEPKKWWSSSEEWLVVESQVISGDYDMDGNLDLLIMYNYGDRRARMWFFQGYGAGFYAPQVWWDSGADGWNGRATRIVAGDFNADGLMDIFGLYSHANKRASAWVFVNTVGKYSNPIKLWDSGEGNWDGERTKIVSGDFDGDGIVSSVAAITDSQDKGVGIFLLGPVDDQSETDLWVRQF